MDTAALDRGPGPHEADGASQPGVAVDDAEHWGSEPASHKIIETALPRCERLASAQFQGEQMFVPVG